MTEAIVKISGPLTIPELKEQVLIVHSVLEKVMVKDQHYGLIPGCGNKPALFKSGAEKLNLTFHMAPKYEIVVNNLPHGHREYEITCSLYHIASGNFLGSGVGCCSTMESKYRYRQANKKCPICGKEAIIKGKTAYGGGWVCFDKKGGCKAKWKDGDKAIEAQKTGRIENEDLADQFNTIKKMAKKRAHVDAVLTATAASDIFTQDIDEMKPANTETNNGNVIDAEFEKADKKPSFEKIMGEEKTRLGEARFNAALKGQEFVNIFEICTKTQQLKFWKYLQTLPDKKKKADGKKTEELFQETISKEIKSLQDDLI